MKTADNWRGKKTANIESIRLMTPEEIAKQFNKQPPLHSDGLPLAVILFKFHCKWTTLTIDELLEIIKYWIIAEEKRYPKKDGYKGRDMLLDEIKKVFEETP